MHSFLLSTAELEAFAPVWRELWLADPSATPFQSPEWLIPWWHQFGHEQQLLCVCIHKEGRCIGLLPFYSYSDPHASERRLLLLGVGTSDYLDGVFAPHCSVHDIQQALGALLASDAWDTLMPTQLAPASRLLQAMQGFEGSELLQGESCSEMAALKLGELPQKIRRNAMYYRNRAAREGSLQLTAADQATAVSAFGTLQRLHTERWQQQGGAGVLADPLVLAWHREALPELARAGLLFLVTLTLDQEPLGVLYALADPPTRQRRRLYFYITAYSIARADLRPGTLLLALAIDKAASEGVAVIDMLRGDEEYKKLWHLQRTATFGFALTQAALRSSTSKASQKSE